jgi:hypothetical protein
MKASAPVRRSSKKVQLALKRGGYLRSTMSLTKLSRTSVLALALALMLVLTACGSDDDGASGQRADRQEITVNWGAEPPSLDPGSRPTRPRATSS